MVTTGLRRDGKVWSGFVQLAQFASTFQTQAVTKQLCSTVPAPNEARARIQSLGFLLLLQGLDAGASLYAANPAPHANVRLGNAADTQEGV